MPLDGEPIIGKSLQNRYKDAYDDAVNAKRNGGLPTLPEEPFDEVSYQAECSVLPPTAFENVHWDDLIPEDYKLLWGHGSKCCLAALPFDAGTNNRAQMEIQGTWKRFVDNKQFMRLLNVMPATRLTTGFPSMADAPGRYFDVLPELLQRDVDQGGCTFSVSYQKPFDMTDSADRAYFIGQCQKALENLKRILGVAPLKHHGLN